MDAKFRDALAGWLSWDVYTVRLPHNVRLYVRPDDQKVLVFPWDMGLRLFEWYWRTPVWHWLESIKGHRLTSK